MTPVGNSDLDPCSINDNDEDEDGKGGGRNDYQVKDKKGGIQKHSGDNKLYPDGNIIFGCMDGSYKI